MTNEIQKSVREILEEQIQKEGSTKKSINHPLLTYKKDKVSVVSLFCGAGGFDLGTEWAGIQKGLGRSIDIKDKDEYERNKKHNIFHTIYALDNSTEAIDTYKSHFKDTVAQKVDIRSLAKFPYADLYTFGFPCPGFSAAGPRLVDDKRNFLYIHCCRALIEAQPKMFVAENVPGMLTLGKGEVFKQIKEDFAAAGYKVYTYLLNSEDYGVPQLRSRVILVGVRNDLDYVYKEPIKTHGKGLKPYVTLKQAIGEIEDPGLIYDGGYSSRYMGRNRKKCWNDQSFTIQASARQAPMHPGGKPMIKVGKELWRFAEGGDNRRMGTKEAARIQTFPKWFNFKYGKEDVSHNTKVDKIFKQIGNAVPVLMAKCIMEPIAEYLYSIKENDKSSEIYEDNFKDNFFEEGLFATGYVEEKEDYPTPLEAPVQLSLFDIL